MSKFKVSLKLQALELNIEGDREDIPQISREVGNGLAGLIQAPAKIVEGRVTSTPANILEIPATSSNKSRRSAKHGSSSKSNGEHKEETLNWKNDPTKWGNPQQSWKTAQKAIWLLYVAKQETGVDELSGSLIVSTFNKHFKQSKTITLSNTNRDLGKYKGKLDAPIGENTAKGPYIWYLTQAGEKMAQQLVIEARSESTVEA